MGERERKKINYVNEISPRKAVIIKKNKACYFIIPLLGFSHNWFTYLINCYVGDNTNKPDLTFKKIFIHVKFYDEKMLGIIYFNHYYRLEDDTYIYVYDIPEEFEEDYIKFCNGKYSEISELCKNLICNKSGIRPIMDSLVYKVLYKTNDQKELIENIIGQELPMIAEVYSKPDLDKEIYNGALEIYSTNKLKLEEDNNDE